MRRVSAQSHYERSCRSSSPRRLAGRGEVAAFSRAPEGLALGSSET